MLEYKLNNDHPLFNNVDDHQSIVPSFSFDLDFNEIAKEEAKKIVAGLIKKKLNNDLKNGNCKDKKMQKLFDRLNPPESRPILWVTFNPDPKKNMTLDIFKNKMEQVIIKKWIHKGWYSYELSCKGRLHVHMLIQNWDKKCPAHIKRELRNPFKEYIDNPKAIDVNNKYLMDVYNDKLEYCKGNKWDKDKTEGVKKTKEFRAANGLDDIYYF